MSLKHNYEIIKDFIKYSFIKSKAYIPRTTFYFSAMTLNLRKDDYTDGNNSWKYRKNKIINLITTHTPHVIGMQEVMPHMFKFILSKLNFRYTGYGVNNFSGINLNTSITTYKLGNAIIWDKTKYNCFDKGIFWLSDITNKPNCSWGNTEPRTCIYVGLRDIITDETYYIFNTHLDHLQGNRKKMSDLIASKIKDKINSHNVVFMGDLNIDLNINSEKTEIKSIDNILDCTYNYTKDLTFNAWKPKLTKTLDAIYFNMTNVICSVINSNVSDHLPVIIYKTN